MRRLLLASALVSLCAAEGGAKLLLSKQQALDLAFGGAAVEKKTAYLDERQMAAVADMARAPVGDGVWTYYVAAASGAVVGYAYFDRVIVRTLPAVLMTVVDPDGRARFTEILTFNEPLDYLPRKRWLNLFRRRLLDGELRLRGAIKNVVGSTLTSEAITSSVRRCLALHAILHPRTEKNP